MRGDIFIFSVGNRYRCRSMWRKHDMSYELGVNFLMSECISLSSEGVQVLLTYLLQKDLSVSHSKTHPLRK